MKLAVFSDSHTDIEIMAAVINRDKPDAIIHLGDHYSDAIKLGRRFTGLALHAVTGNCDFASGGSSELIITLGGKKLLLTHGHNYHVKGGLSYIKERGLTLGVHAALFGHTHMSILENVSGMLLINPGHIGRLAYNGNPPTYALINIENGELNADILYGDDAQPILER